MQTLPLISGDSGSSSNSNAGLSLVSMRVNSHLDSATTATIAGVATLTVSVASRFQLPADCHQFKFGLHNLFADGNSNESIIPNAFQAKFGIQFDNGQAFTATTGNQEWMSFAGDGTVQFQTTDLLNTIQGTAGQYVTQITVFKTTDPAHIVPIGFRLLSGGDAVFTQDGIYVGDALHDSGTFAASSTTNAIGPSCVFGKCSCVSAISVGDSIDANTIGPGMQSHGPGGYWWRMMLRQYGIKWDATTPVSRGGCIVFSHGGAALSDIVTGSVVNAGFSRRFSVLQKVAAIIGGRGYVFTGLSTNDDPTTITLAQHKLNMQGFVSVFAGLGLKTVWRTLFPRVSSTNLAQTIAGQTPTGGTAGTRYSAIRAYQAGTGGSFVADLTALGLGSSIQIWPSVLNIDALGVVGIEGQYWLPATSTTPLISLTCDTASPTPGATRLTCSALVGVTTNLYRGGLILCKTAVNGANVGVGGGIRYHTSSNGSMTTGSVFPASISLTDTFDVLNNSVTVDLIHPDDYAHGLQAASGDTYLTLH